MGAKADKLQRHIAGLDNQIRHQQKQIRDDEVTTAASLIHHLAFTMHDQAEDYKAMGRDETAARHMRIAVLVREAAEYLEGEV